MPEPNPAEVRPMIRAGLDLIKIKARLKEPVETGWRTASRAHHEILTHMTEGGNAGWRLGAGDLVLDIDPRNFHDGDDPLARLVIDTGLELDRYPHVLTGSGGHHYYLMKPPDLKILDSLPDYPGIEFKTRGRQVVIPGSVHPNGNYYEWDDFAPPPAERPPAPEALLTAIRRPERTANAEGGELTPEQVELLLAQLPVEEYRMHDTWLAVMMACHHASGGEARQEFVAWSTSDPNYANHGSQIGVRWDSLHADRGTGVTYLTLYHEVRNKGGTVPWETAQADFDDDLDLAPEQAGIRPELARLAQMNEAYCVVKGSPLMIYQKQFDPELKRYFYARQSPIDLQKWYANDLVPASPTSDKMVNRFEWWFGQRQRRQYEGIVMMPPPQTAPEDYLNLWQGPSVKPTAAPWPYWEELLRTVIAASDTEFYDYLIKWLAYLVQFPGNRSEVALAIRGAKGTGKGTFGRAIFEMFSAHALHVSSAEHFTGRFNAHLRELVYIFVDEAFWAGDKRSEGQLKRLITEPTLVYEGKGRDVVIGPNRISAIIASNENWVVPAGLDGERRYAVMDVSECRRGQGAWYDKVQCELYQKGGLGGFYQHLLGIDLKEWHPRDKVPQTAGLTQQKLEGLNSIEAWWLEKLQLGILPGQRNPWTLSSGTECPSEALRRDHNQSADERNIHAIRPAQVMFGAALKKLIPRYRTRQAMPNDDELELLDHQKRLMVTCVPSLFECRAFFEKMLGRFSWGASEDEIQNPGVDLEDFLL